MIPGSASDSGSEEPRIDARQPRAVFVLHRLGLHTGGLTKVWLGRVRLFEAAGWSVHVALISDDPEIDETVRVLRLENRLPWPVQRHNFSRDRRGPPGRVSARLRHPWHPSQAESVAAWLDRVASPDGALLFSDSPLGYPHLAKMVNPRVARVYVVHLAHLSAEATRLPTRSEVANGPLTKRWSAVSDEAIRAGAACVISTTRREAMPLTLLETLAVGTPVVVYDVRYGPREIVRDGVDGFVVPAQDITAGAAAVVCLLTEPALRDQMSHNARQVTDRFSRQAHDHAWLTLGHALYQQRSRRAG